MGFYNDFFVLIYMESQYWILYIENDAMYTGRLIVDR